MPTIKEFEMALRAQGMTMALALLDKLRQEQKATRTINRSRRVSGKKMTPELARRVVELNRTTNKTQQEIAFELGVNQGRVNEVLKHGKWLNSDPRDRVSQPSKGKPMQKPSRELPQRTDPILGSAQDLFLIIR